MLTYTQFYRNNGIRKFAQMVRPPLPPVALLRLPIGSIYHYVGTNSMLDQGPASDDLMFAKVTKPIYMQHVIQNGDNLGHPTKRTAELPDTFIRPYHIRNRRFKRMQDASKIIQDPHNLVIFNYAYISRMYNYQRSIYTEYNRWHNIQAAMWNKINGLSQECEHHHYIRIGIPKILPSVQQLMNAEKNGMTQAMAKIFTTPESMFILEVWKYLGGHVESSVFKNLDKKYFERINLVFLESGRWTVMNLGKLASWRKATKEELEKNPEASKKGVDAVVLQRGFLRLLMVLFETRTIAPPEFVPEEEGNESDDETVSVVKKLVVDPVSGKAEMKDVTDGVTAIVTPNTADDTADTIEISEEMNAKIEADLAELETIANKVNGIVNAAGELVPEVRIEEPVDLEQAVVAVAERHAENGAISAAEFLRFKKAAGTYKTLKVHDGKTTLEQFVQIPKAAVEIKESKAIKDIRTVIDKSMLRSSLLDFDERYAKDVIHRDVASMVVHVQNAGIAVTEYDSEVVETATGTYRDYTIKVVPVEGAPSTWRFKIPELKDDGSYEANGVKYRLRKQKIDYPLRKTAPDKVALTSYYGKTFITRSQKRVNDYPKWLCNSIMAKGLDDTDPTVIDLHPGNVFDYTFPSPRLYSTLAMNYRGFTTAGFQLSFDHTKREALYGKDAMKIYETEGSLIIGKNAKNQLLIMAKDDDLYVGENGKLKEFPALENLLHLDGNKAPVEFAELKVYSHAIPVGVVLAYEMGLSNLIKQLGVQPRRVQAGSRLNLEPNEYALVFSDESLIFSRDDKLAAMILGGFSEYRHAIRAHNAFLFDKRDVYWNILDANGIGTSYLREIDHMYQMFVDPITKELLIEMKEPTTFRGLLLRGSEMLLVDQHPHELDAAYQRLRGNERMAGAVYSALVDAIRTHNGRSGKGRYPIDLYPYAVWESIAKDSSNSLLSEINPIQNLKEIEAVTYSGTGGRSSRSMTRATRAYHKNDMGTISEATVDSGMVAINTSTSADPQFTSLRGISKRYEEGVTGATALLSTSSLLAVGTDRDD